MAHDAPATRSATASGSERPAATAGEAPLGEVAAPVHNHVPAMMPMPPTPLTLPPDSDLVLVETSHHAPAPAIDEVAPPRPKRVRRPRVEAASEPLEIIETRKEPPAPV